MRTTKTVPTHKTETFAGIIRQEKTSVNKKLTLLAPRSFQHFANKCQDGEKVTVSVTTKKWRRSLEQNNYYWGVYLPIIADETGHTPDELHELFKGKFLTQKIKTVMGLPVRMKKSTRDLSVGEFVEYIQRIESFTGIEAPPTENYNLPELKHEVASR